MKMPKFLVMDVDGTLTDGKIYMSDNGELFKAFNIKDGCGIKDILPQYGIVPVIITARKSKLLALRCKELRIEELHQGISDKYTTLETIVQKYTAENHIDYSLKDVAFIGDDILDLQCMIPIASEGGLVGCPADAVNEVKKISSFVSSNKGGEGAVRDFIEWIVRRHQ